MGSLHTDRDAETEPRAPLEETSSKSMALGMLLGSEDLRAVYRWSGLLVVLKRCLEPLKRKRKAIVLHTFGIQARVQSTQEWGTVSRLSVLGIVIVFGYLDPLVRVVC